MAEVVRTKKWEGYFYFLIYSDSEIKYARNYVKRLKTWTRFFAFTFLITERLTTPIDSYVASILNAQMTNGVKFSRNGFSQKRKTLVYGKNANWNTSQSNSNKLHITSIETSQLVGTDKQVETFARCLFFAHRFHY